MATQNIDTNPEALRTISSSVSSYLATQNEIIRSYLTRMTALTEEIQIQKYQMFIEAISSWLNRMEELRSDGEEFASWLNEKANMLEQFSSQSGGV